MNNKTSRVREFNINQYRHKVKFPKLYFMLGPLVKHREQIALDNLPGGEKILDVGCGEGKLLIKASEKYKMGFGVDIVPFRVKKAKDQAKKRRIDNLKFYVRNIDTDGLGFKNNEFDAVVCLAVMEYLFDPYFILEQFNRILKKGGILVIEVPNIAYLLERIRLLFGKLPDKGYAQGWTSGRLHHFTLETLEKLIKENGFTIIKRTGSGFMPILRSWWLSLLSADLIIIAKKNE